MGTSSSHGGPKGKNPLLPKDFNDEPFDGNKVPDSDPLENQKTEAWKNAKTQVSKLISNTDRNTETALSAYVKAHGGGKGAAGAAISGKATTVNLGNFLASTSSQGFRTTLDQYQIQYENRTVQEVLSDIVNKIAPSPNTKEDAVARNALIDTMEILYDEIEDNDGNINILDNLNSEKFNELMNTYISSYIFQKFLSEMESRFEKYASNEGSALSIENEIKEYISGTVDNKLADRDFSNINFTSKTVMETINQIYEECYSVIEGAIS